MSQNAAVSVHEHDDNDGNLTKNRLQEHYLLWDMSFN